MNKVRVFMITLVAFATLGACGRGNAGDKQESQTHQTVVSEDFVTDSYEEESSENVNDEKQELSETTLMETTKTEADDKAEDTVIIQKLKAQFGENCIAEQTFQVELSEYNGKVYFVPYAPSKTDSEFSMQIIQNGEVLTNIYPYVPETLARESFTSLDAVSFCDVNFDDNTDILMIMTYGNTTFAGIYYGFDENAEDYDRRFRSQEKLSSLVTKQVEMLTISNIRMFLTEGKKNGTFQSYQDAYLTLSNLCQLEGRYEDYNLIYFDEDDIPELVAGLNGYYMSMYTYKDGIIYPLMDEWCYGAGGNHGYEYAPKKNSLRNYDTDYAGAILYTTYATVNEEFSMETIAEFKLVNFDDANGNGMLDANEEDSVGLYSVQYLNGKEISGEEKMEYDQGVYENIRGTMSLEELQEKLEE